MPFLVICITMNEILRICRVCKDPKPPADFRPDRRVCRKCVSKVNSRRLRSNSTRYGAFKTYQKQWELDNHERRKQYDLGWRKNNVERLLLYHAKARAKRYNVECSLGLEDIIIPNVCPVLKIPIKADLMGSDNSPSLDRLVPSKGYTKENTRVISCRANVIKNCGTTKEHEMIVEYMKENGC